MYNPLRKASEYLFSTNRLLKVGFQPNIELLYDKKFKEVVLCVNLGKDFNYITMDKYRININNNIPQKFWGLFNSENDSDYLLFFNSKPITDLDVIMKFEISQDKVKKLILWDCLPINSGQGILMNQRTQDILMNLCPNNVEFIKPSSFVINDDFRIELDYKMLHLLTDADTNPIYRIGLGNIGISPHLIDIFKKSKIKGIVYDCISR